MVMFYLVCAGAGGTVMLIQVVMSVFGWEIGHGDFSIDHMDVAHEGAHDSSFLFGMISARALTAGAAFFGMAGLAANSAGFSPWATFAAASGAGLAVMSAVAVMMRGLSRLRADGTARIENAVGMPATVYLTIPAKGMGVGKITVAVQNRTMEYTAMNTTMTPLATGEAVRVIGTAGAGMVTVAPVDGDKE